VIFVRTMLVDIVHRIASGSIEMLLGGTSIFLKWQLIEVAGACSGNVDQDEIVNTIIADSILINIK
jgi:hypothetical protein